MSAAQQSTIDRDDEPALLLGWRGSAEQRWRGPANPVPQPSNDPTPTSPPDSPAEEAPDRSEPADEVASAFTSPSEPARLRWLGQVICVSTATLTATLLFLAFV